MKEVVRLEKLKLEIKYLPINSIVGYVNNTRTHSQEQINQVKSSISEFGMVNPIGLHKNVILSGHCRWEALKQLDYKEVPTVDLSHLTEAQKKAYIIADNKLALNAGWNEELLKIELESLQELDFDLDILGFDDTEIDDILVFSEELEEEKEEKQKKLSDRFIIPPFSVLDTKQGIWQQRKNYWLSLGIKSEEGRDAICITGNNAILSDGTEFSKFNTDVPSIFDPVLCELAYKWFNTPNGKILDCFAGGSVRGIVAAKLGYEYLGNDLRNEQIEANRINAKEVLQDAEIYPTWTCGDSLNIDTIAKGYEADLLFSCPPYADLEVYSDKKEDLSNMPYKDFIAVYREIIRKSCSLLKEDRFAVFVVGDIRDKKGFYKNFVSDTIQAFVDSGALLYNEMILVNMIGNLPMRVGRHFAIGRKAGKQHQNVLVFYKGDPKKIKDNYKELDLSYMEEEELTNNG